LRYEYRKTLSWRLGEPVPAWLPWFGLLFLLVGLGMLGGGFWSYQKEVEFDKATVSTSGTVIDLISRSSTRSSATYSPVVQFIDQSGNEQELHSRVGSNPPAYRLGEKVTVLYKADNPEFAVIDDWERYLGLIVLTIMGFVFSWVLGSKRVQMGCSRSRFNNAR